MINYNLLAELNAEMLMRGAPVELDYHGYNAFDYETCKSIRAINDDRTALRVANALCNYTNTQLKSYANDLHAIKKELEDKLGITAMREHRVTVFNFNDKTVSLTWMYNSDVSKAISNMDKALVRWTKPNGKWVLVASWKAVPELNKVLTANGYNTADMMDTYNNRDKLMERQLEVMKGIRFKVLCTRPEHYIDTWLVKFVFPQDAPEKLLVTVSQIMKSASSSISYDKLQHGWKCYLKAIPQVRKGLQDAGLSVDTSALDPLANLFESWNHTYTLPDDMSKAWSGEQAWMPFAPFSYQLEDAQTMLEHKCMLNASEMGSGKTLVGILAGESIPMKKLVIVPPTLRLNWQKEIRMVNPDVPVNIIYNDTPFQVVDGWNIIGYSSLSKFQKQLEAAMFQVVILDEAHYIQAINSHGAPDSNRSKVALRVAATAEYVFPLTGTPKTNRNVNLYNLLRILRHPLASSDWAFWNYTQAYCGFTRTQWGSEFNGNSNDEDLHNKLVPYMVRRLKKDVLPNLHKQRVVIPVKADLREYHWLVAEYLKNRTNKNAEALAALQAARRVLARQKVGETIDMVEGFVETGEKVVVVTCFNDVLTAVQKAFPSNSVCIKGGMSDTQKDTAIQLFQTGKPQVMVMNIVAGGVGVTLTRSHIIVMNDYDWTPGNEVQAEDRICRPGQTECCMVYYMTAYEAETDATMVDTLTSKFDTINAAIDGGKGEAIDYMTLVHKAMEAGVGTHKVRKAADVVTELTEEDKQQIAAIASELKPMTVVAASRQTTVKSVLTPKQPQTVKTVKQPKAENPYKAMTNEELETLANTLQLDVPALKSRYPHEGIYRMRLVMAIKAANK